MENQTPTRIVELINDARRNVDVQVSNFSSRELVRMVEDGEMNISPEYQRLFQWDGRSESRLIESMMLGLPIPSIFVATNEDFTLEVVDGLQRLSTLLHFLTNSAASLERLGKSHPLVLCDLETLPELNGLSFQDLPTPLKLHLSRSTLTVTALTDKSDREVRFELFDRLNAGSLKLTNQEVRNAVYRGPFVSFLRDLAAQKDFLATMKWPDATMRDGTLEEIVLRFFGYRNNFDRYKGPIKPFLNDCMREWKDVFPEAEFREDFEGAVRTLGVALAGSPYLRGSYGFTPLMAYESALIAAAEVRDKGGDVEVSASWKEDGNLRAVSQGGDNTPKKFRKRVDRTKELLLGAEPVLD